MKAALGTDGKFMFWCPGCDESHGIPVDGSRGWTWNQSLESPTISPSILVKAQRALVDGKPVHFFKYEGPYPCEKVDFICHSFIREGRIEFCSDSSHALAGQTVDLPDWPQ